MTGDKYVNFQRSSSPPSTRYAAPLNYSNLDAKFAGRRTCITRSWRTVAYRSTRRDSCANLNVLYVDDPGKNTLQPEATRTCSGTTWWETVNGVGGRLHHQLQQSNRPFFTTFNNTSQAISKLGRVKYKASSWRNVCVGMGFSVYANASYKMRA